MTAAKRRPATPANQGPTRAATKDSSQEAPTGDADGDSAPPTGDADGDSAPPTETGQVDPEDRATTQSPGRSALHPERVWPD
jgi:hypothetical protein